MTSNAETHKIVIQENGVRVLADADPVITGVMNR